jgi:predicted nuclease of predicted toxin-antitoxin system
VPTTANRSGEEWARKPWIAAVALVQGAVVVTTDQDFDHLAPTVVKVERIDVASLTKTSS